MRHITLSPYIITWVEIRPISGRKVTNADANKMGIVTVHRNGYAYAFFANKERAIAWLETQLDKTYSKSYEARLFTDKQYGMATASNGYAIPFTSKQKADVFKF